MTVNQFILNDSRSNILVVEEAKNVEKVLQAWNELKHLKKIVQYSGNTVVHKGESLTTSGAYIVNLRFEGGGMAQR